MKNKNTGVIYRIWNTANGMSYIGQTIQKPENRIHRHFKDIACPRLSHAIHKHGGNVFQYEIIETNILHEHLNEREIYWIKHFNSVSPNGYNLTHGGNAAGTMSEEARLKISIKNKGRRHTEETRRKISENQKGKTISEEHKQRLSEVHKGKTVDKETRQKMSEHMRGKNNPNYGKTHSTETRRKISEANKGKTQSEEHRRKNSEANTGEKNHFYGKSHSEETRRKISETQKRKNRAKKTSPLQLPSF